MKLNNFHYIAVLLDMLYGIELEDEDLEELGLLGWNLIGNKNTRLYKYNACIGKDNSVKLPCNVESVEAVTASYEDWNRVTNYSELGDFRTSFIEQHIEAEKLYRSPYYIPGKLLKYEQVGDTLYFDKNYGTIHILYKGILADEEGLPELTDNEANAIATYIAYVMKYKEGLATNNTVAINLANSLKANWLQQCDQARITKLNQNDMNEILDVKTSWDRKSYGYGYKILK